MITQEKKLAILQVVQSLRTPFEYVIGASLIIAQDQCFHFDIEFISYKDLRGELHSFCKCRDCGKELDKNELKRFMI
jgi:hypothetical protein